MFRRTVLLAALFSFCVGTASWAMMNTATIEDIMTKGHKKGGFRDQINIELKKGTPDWTAVQTAASEFKTLAEDLGKNKPPKGSEASWKKACDEYFGYVKELDAATQQKNKSKSVTALGKIGKTCTGCHNAHRP